MLREDQIKESADSISLIILGDDDIGKSVLLSRYSIVWCNYIIFFI